MQHLSGFDVNAFPFWGGAEDTIEEVKKAGKMDDLQQ